MPQHQFRSYSIHWGYRLWMVLPLGLFSSSVIAISEISPAVAVDHAMTVGIETTAEPTVTPASPQACMALDSNADRLTCYDVALGRQATAPLNPLKTNLESSTAETAAAAPDTIESHMSNREATTPSPNLTQRVLDNLNIFSQEKIQADNTNLSLLDRRWELSEQSKLGRFNIRAYKPVYLLPAIDTSRINDLPNSPNPVNQVSTPQDLKHVEAKFQLSLKTKAVEGVFGEHGDIWLGYTQVSRWQVYNDDESRPFRETNYEPEASLIFNTNYQIFGWDGRLLGLTLNHQSNGRALPLSRSWNRAILNIGLERDNWVLMLKPWYRFGEDADKDDNADIEDFLGKGELQLIHKRNQHEYALLLRHNLESGSAAKGAVQFDWTFPVKSALRGHVQIFDGYGESLIDYNHRATYVGLGISLLNWY
ncbi:MAG: phospholipase A [Pseudomonadota bacterium]|nr:phospholipase A [Pseudomonadota bacterium]